MAAFLFWAKYSFGRLIEKRFEEASSRAIRENIEAILAIASSTLEEKTKQIHETLSGNEKSIESLVAQVQAQVKNYQQEIKTTEQDRAVKFNEILTLTSRLTSSTDKLNRILSTNNLRGQWGERIADDILKSTGLLEGVHYQKNKQLDTNANRPDFTFFLPEGYKINMDVKFPITNLVKAQEIEEPSEQKKYLKDFETDVKNRIQEIVKRDYVNPAENTVDFAILFVPSESVYASIHATCADLFGYAEEKRVILAAPFTLIAILKVILQSFRHFYYEQKIRDIVSLIEKLGEDLVRFQDRFSGFETHIEKMRQAYQEIAKTSFQKIQSKIEQIKLHQSGASQSSSIKVSGDREQDESQSATLMAR
ncbi:MAG: DNA recombination protein RmuC [Candidatus Omnitrophica bacterium]|nr:DNA recombination protein RmuC [Candidatus Omnitrophota bacterium]